METKATRSELLATRAQAVLAKRARDLLQDKRDALVGELREAAAHAAASADALDEAATQARTALAVAEAADGPHTVRSAGLAAAGDVFVETVPVNVMGLRLLRLEHPPVLRPARSRGYSPLVTGPRVDVAADRFETELQVLLRVADSELRLRRLAAEITRTTRRLNALELVHIPRLRRRIHEIALVLDEREREDRFRLARAKARASTGKEIPFA